MTRPITLGAVFLPTMAPEQLKSVALAADQAGLPELWLWEDCFKESGITAMSAVLAWTTQVRVGIGLLPVPLRNVAMTAMEVATLERLFPDRVIAGIGHGVQEWMGQVGARVSSPMTLLREYTVALRALLDGGLVTTTGTYVSLDRVQLTWPPEPPGPLLVGAVGPKSLALSGELADGTILTGGTTAGQVRAARDIVDAAAARSGHRHHRIVVFLIAATGAGSEARLKADLERWDPTGTLDITGIAGDATAVARRVQELGDAGADTVVLQPTEDEPDIEEFVRITAQDVRAALDELLAR